MNCFFVGFRTYFVTYVSVSIASAGVLALAGLRPVGTQKPQGGGTPLPPPGYVPESQRGSPHSSPPNRMCNCATQQLLMGRGLITKNARNCKKTNVAPIPAPAPLCTVGRSVGQDFNTIGSLHWLWQACAGHFATCHPELPAHSSLQESQK